MRTNKNSHSNSNSRAKKLIPLPQILIGKIPNRVISFFPQPHLPSM
jgi:hypothetical protein